MFRLLLLVRFWLLLFPLAGCSNLLARDPNLDTGIATPLPHLTAEPLPDFLGWVHPSPASAQVMETFIQEAYVTGGTVLESEPAICISFETFSLFEPSDDLTVAEALNRLSVVVDGVVFNEIGDHILTDDYPRLPEDPQTGEPLAQFEGGSNIMACFPAELGPGLHTATFVARKSSGDELRHTWSFILIETPPDAPPYEQRPFSLPLHEPAPGAVMPIDRYRNDRTLEDLELSASTVCVFVQVYGLRWDLGTQSSLEEIVPLSYLLLNGVPVHQKTSTDVYGDQSFYQLCFLADLETGLHTATFVMRDAQENALEYTWYFLLVE